MRYGGFGDTSVTNGIIAYIDDTGCSEDHYATVNGKVVVVSSTSICTVYDQALLAQTVCRRPRGASPAEDNGQTLTTTA